MNTQTQFICVTNQLGFNTVQPTRFQYTKDHWLRLLGASKAAGRPSDDGRTNQPSIADLSATHWLSLLSGSPQTGGSYANGRNGNGTGPATALEPAVFLTPEYWLHLLGGSR